MSFIQRFLNQCCINWCKLLSSTFFRLLANVCSSTPSRWEYFVSVGNIFMYSFFLSAPFFSNFMPAFTKTDSKSGELKIGII